MLPIYNELYGEVALERGTFFRLQEWYDERVRVGSHGEPPHRIFFGVPLPPRLQRLALLTCARNLDIIKSEPFFGWVFCCEPFFARTFGAGLPEDYGLKLYPNS